jgi:predicted RND superfamily exporter protein
MMSTINSALPGNLPAIQPLPSITPEVDFNTSDEEIVVPTHSAGKPLVVTISAEGKEKLAGEQKNADIDATHLPESIKKYLKTIREIQEKIDKKLEELQAAMSNQTLSDKDREAKVNKIQLELTILTSTLTSITNDLQQKEVETKLQAPDLKLINALMARR